MTTPMTRELSIVYGTLTVGGSSGRPINSYTKVREEYTKAAYEFTFVTLACSTQANFAAECAAVEAAFRKPRQDLVVSENGNTLLSLKQSLSTGLDAEPSIEKVGSVADTGLSREYRVRIEFGRPADNVATVGLRYSTVNIEYSPGRRRKVTISGTWTAISTTTALAHYLANCDAFCTAQLAAIFTGGEKSEMIGEPRVEQNSTNKTLEFTRIYQEFIYPDAGQDPSVMDDPDIVLQTLKISREKVAPGDTNISSTPDQSSDGGNANSPGVEYSSGTVDTVVSSVNNGSRQSFGNRTSVHRLIKIVVNYDAWIKPGISALNKYMGTIRSWLIQQVDDFNDYGQMALVFESPDPVDQTDRRITARMEFLAQGPTRVLQYKVTTADPENYGIVLVPAWSGDQYTKYRYPGPASKQRVIVEEKRVLGNHTQEDVQGNFSTSDSGGMKAAILSKEPSITPLTLGLPGATMDVTDVTVRTVIEFYKPITSTASSAASHQTVAGPATPTPRASTETQ